MQLPLNKGVGGLPRSIAGGFLCAFAPLRAKNFIN
jgi:hypothetical protein